MITDQDISRIIEAGKKAFLTKDDAKLFLTKNDAKNFLTKNDAKNFLTKNDAKNFLTKKDAKNFLTKNDAKNFLTKNDAKNFLTKNDSKRLLTRDNIGEIIEAGKLVFATKVELHEFKEEIRGDFAQLVGSVDGLSKEIKEMHQELKMHNIQLNRHDRWHHDTADKIGLKLEY